MVFKTNDFRFFIEEHKINNSFTDYKNLIGLTDGKFFLKDTQDVVLNFPYKDCLLEGGQSTEEGEDVYYEYDEKVTASNAKKGHQANSYNRKTAKRKEIFFNEVLAFDEIDRLLDKKALVNWQKFSKDGTEKPTQLKRNAEGTITDNLIIKGNNLLALHSLKSEFAGKVKLIYIDPPYNTGNDGFKYNDNFNHSTWLTFMKNRLEIAKHLLSDDGTIAISIDNKEMPYLSILMDEIFGVKNKNNLITIKRSSVSGAKVINNGVVNVSEYVIFYSKNSESWKPNKVFKEKQRDSRYNKFIVNKKEHFSKWQYITILDAFAEQNNIEKSKLKKYFGNNYQIELENFIFDNSENIIRFASLDDRSISKPLKELKYISKGNKEETFILEREKFSNYYIYNGEAILFFDDRLITIDGKKVFGELITDIWDDVLPNDLHNEGSISFKKGKKPEKLIERIINLFSNPNDLVLDFHLGSGTTCAVAHKMGRQYIGIEQMDYIETIALERMKKVIDGEQGGISKAVQWQGGGEFIYCELAEYNQQARKLIAECNSFEELKTLFQEKFYQQYFLHYNIKTKEFAEKIINEENFANLSLDKQKKIFIGMLDNNQLYVNYSEIDEEKFAISDEDKALTYDFYLIK